MFQNIFDVRCCIPFALLKINRCKKWNDSTKDLKSQCLRQWCIVSGSGGKRSTSFSQISCSLVSAMDFFSRVFRYAPCRQRRSFGCMDPPKQVLFVLSWLSCIREWISDDGVGKRCHGGNASSCDLSATSFSRWILKKTIRALSNRDIKLLWKKRRIRVLVLQKEGPEWSACYKVAPPSRLAFYCEWYLKLEDIRKNSLPHIIQFLFMFRLSNLVLTA